MSSAPKIALITGAGKRIGRHLALSLAQKGWHIAATYNTSEQETQTLQNEIQEGGQKCFTTKVDLAIPAEVDACLPACIEALGPPSLLINNASLFLKDDPASFTASEFDQHMAVNLKAPLLLAQAFAKAERAAATEAGEAQTSAQANIINLTDQRVENPGTSFFSYSLSKIGLASATQTMAQSFAPRVRVNAIAPGPVLQSVHQTAEEFQKEWHSTPLRRGTTLEELERAVDMILHTPSMTGTTLYLDGGQRLGN